MGNGLLDFLARTGRGIGAAGRDIGGQMFGSTGPMNPSTLGGRFGNIIANEANPLGMLQTGQAFMDGFRGQPGTAPDRFAASTEAISQRAASARPPGSVVARGYIGQRGMTRQPEQRNVLGYRLGESPTSERDPNWRMPGVSNAPPPAPGGGGQRGRSTAHVSGGDVSLAEHMARQRMRAESEQ